MADSGVELDTTHRHLVAKSDKIEELGKRTEQYLSELRTYSNLPPDVTKAQIMIEQAKNRLKELDKELTESLHL